MTENTASVSELWMGFLDYYSRIFDFGAEVVQIRRSERLSKLDKGWQGRPIAIEDPFDLKHNLSSGVHMRSMVHFFLFGGLITLFFFDLRSLDCWLELSIVNSF